MKSRQLIASSIILGITIMSIFLLGMHRNDAENRRELLGKLLARSSRAITNSPWGIQIGTLEKDHLAKAAAIGVKWTRLNASWSEIERERGVYNWEKNDQAFAYALDNGITPFVCFAGANRLYCKESEEKDPRQREIYGSSRMPPTKDPKALAAWLRFVKATVERYKEKIHYWEIWNEPNHPHYWGAPPDGNEYGVLVRETARVIREADPQAKILAGALAGLDPEFTDKFLANGAAQMIDIVTFHNYGELPEERIYKAMEVWSVINKHKPSLELWQGECGYPSHSNTRDYRGTSPWGVMIQAKWLLRQSFTDVFFCRTTLSNYFKLVHPGERGVKPQRSMLTSVDSVLGFPARGGARVKSVGVNEKCVLENPSLTPKPAYYAYQNLCAVFDSRYKPVRTGSNIKISDPGVFYGIGDEDDAFPSIPLVSTFRTSDGKSMVAWWLPWHPQEIIREGSITLTVSAMTFKDPVLIDLLDGEVYSVEVKRSNDGSSSFINVPLADYPFVIAERGEVELGR